METILEAKRYLRENFGKGCSCPACGQTVKLYKRKLNSGMSIVLYYMYRYGNGFVHVKELLREKGLKNNHDWTLLKYWGLIQELDNIPNESGTKSSGHWRITDKGIDFIFRNLSVQKHILIYNNKFQGFSNDNTNFKESLGDDFNFNELMSEVINTLNKI